MIFISHDHFDHCSPEDVGRIQCPETIVVTEKDSKKKLSGDVRTIKAGEALQLEGITIHGVPSYNTDKDFHPRSKGWLGFLIEISGITLYHAGDTDFIPEMKELKVDIAFLPVSGTYVMNADQAVKAALTLEPKFVFPMHYGTIVGGKQDALNFKDRLEGKISVLIPEKE